MRLRLATTVALVFGLVLLLSWPFVVGQRPAPNAPRQQIARYGIRVLAYFGVTAGVWLTTAVFAFLTLRQTRDQFVDEAKRNVRTLIEITLADHARSNTQGQKDDADRS